MNILAGSYFEGSYGMPVDIAKSAKWHKRVFAKGTANLCAAVFSAEGLAESPGDRCNATLAVALFARHAQNPTVFKALNTALTEFPLEDCGWEMALVQQLKMQGNWDRW